jgi:glycosyltransferase involved in cell wall biosynthesis
VGALAAPSVSVIIPAFNEAGYLLETLDRLRAAEGHLKASAATVVEIVVVDNGSTDGTAELAATAGASVVRQPQHNIATVRNAGAAAALHDVLIFLDADTLVPADLLLMIAQEMADPECAGGQASSIVLRGYFRFWRVVGLAGGMAQGACQFCRRRVFEELGGYDETHYMGEDVDFFWRLKRLARRRGLRTTFIRDCQVVPSPRRWESWSVWRTLIWTNPVFAFAFRRRRATWGGWYSEPPR